MPKDGFYPNWEDPEIRDWDEYSDPAFYRDERCLPLGAVLITAAGLSSCRPRRHCYPRSDCYPYGCSPYIACSPTYICYPRQCYPL